MPISGKQYGFGNLTAGTAKKSYAKPLSSYTCALA